jgi:pyridoxamine-phosphate oxidase
MYQNVLQLQDPFEQFDAWMKDAAGLIDVTEPNAVCLATANSSGHPSNRMVLLKGYSEQQGFEFYTNYDSPKGQELDNGKRAALCFYWEKLHRQVRLEGTVERKGQEESVAYFHSRPRSSQLGAWCRRQSTVISNRQVGPLLSIRFLNQQQTVLKFKAALECVHENVLIFGG